MEAHLKTLKVWGIVHGRVKRPAPVAGADGKVPPADAAMLVLQETWDQQRDQATGAITLGIEDSMRTHTKPHKDDPVKMWKALHDACIIKVNSSLFNVYQLLFNYKYDEEQPLVSIHAAIKEIHNTIKDLRPDMLTLDELDESPTPSR